MKRARLSRRGNPQAAAAGLGTRLLTAVVFLSAVAGGRPAALATSQHLPVWSAGACSRFWSGSLLPSCSALGGDRREQAPLPKAGASSRTPHGPVLTWRLCPGTVGTSILPTAPAGGPWKATLRLVPPLIGAQVSAERLASESGRGAWLLEVRVPDGARAGRYAGQIELSHAATIVRRPALIEVLPFELMRPSKQYAVSGVPTMGGECCAPEAADLPALRRLRALGIGSLCLGAAPADRAVVESRIAAAGLRGPVLAPPESWPVGASGTNAAAPLPGSASFHLHWYALCGAAPSPETAAAIRAGGGLIACRVSGPEAAAGIDLPILDAAAAMHAHPASPSPAAGAGFLGWWRWDAGTASALENRLRCGALLWKSGFSGALIDISPGAATNADWPARWDGICQGVQDSRYLTTLFSLIRQVKDKDRSSPLPGQAEVAIAAALNEVTQRPTPASADRVRETAIAEILRLGRLVWS